MPVICRSGSRKTDRIQDPDRNREMRTAVRKTVRVRTGAMQGAQDRRIETTVQTIADLEDRMGKDVRTVRQEARTIVREAASIIMEKAVSATETITEKDVREAVSEETRIVRTTGVRTVRAVRIMEMTVPRTVLAMERTVPVSPVRTASRAVSEERMREEEIPEENRAANLKARIWNS